MGERFATIRQFSRATSTGSSEVEKGVSGGSKAEDSVVEATPRPTVWRTVSNSSMITGGETG